MTKLNRLKGEARKSAGFRNHTMGRFTRSHYWRSTYFARCSQCGMQVTVTPRPAPNEIDIGGEAVALNCRGSQ